jgi:Fe-S cluster assembly iron-binding protein IscA
MVTVTEGAKQVLKEKLLAHTSEPDVGIRLESEPSGQLGLVLDRESEGDQVVEHDEMKVLLVAPELATKLEGITLDTEDTSEGRRLVIRKEEEDED